MLKYTVPIKPISINATYKRGAGRGFYLSDEARNFKDTLEVYARLAAKKANFKTSGECIGVRLDFYFPSGRNDIDGPIKSVLDSLQQAEIVYNDNQIKELSVGSHIDKHAPRVEIYISELKDSDFLGLRWTLRLLTQCLLTPALGYIQPKDQSWP